MSDERRGTAPRPQRRRRGPRAMNGGEIVAAVDVGQSTVSSHLKVLAEVRFVLFEHRGSAPYYRINQERGASSPPAPDIVMGRPVPAQPGSMPAAQPEGARQ